MLFFPNSKQICDKMSISLITLLLMGCVVNAAASLPDYKIEETYCGTTAHEIGVVKENAGSKWDLQMVPGKDQLQNAFKDACKDASDDKTKQVHLVNFPTGHGSNLQGNLKLCCISHSVCTGTEANNFELTEPNKWIVSCAADSPCGPGYRCQNVDVNKKVCCKIEDNLCPNDQPPGEDCSSDNDCNKKDYFAKGHSCMKVALTTSKIACCGVKETDKCPGGFDPFANSVSRSTLASSCGDAEFSDAGYKFKKGHGAEICCPKPHNLRPGWEKLDVIMKDGKPQECSTNAECGDAGFCDEVGHPLMDKVKSNIKFCFPVPSFMGNVVKSAVGLKSCATNPCDSAKGEICPRIVTTAYPDLYKTFLLSVKSETEATEPVCFQLDKCPKQPDNAVLKDLVEPAGENTYMALKEGTPNSEISPVVHDAYRMEVDAGSLTKTNIEQVKLVCKYKNKVGICEAKSTKLALTTTGVRKTCTGHQQCGGGDGVDHDAALEHPLCIGSVCCVAAKCPKTDLLWHEQGKCTQHTDCGEVHYGKGKQSSGICTTDPFKPSSQEKRCCPIAVDNKQLKWPYKTQFECTKVDECKENFNENQVPKKSGLYCTVPKPATDGKPEQKSVCAARGIDSDSKLIKESSCVENSHCSESALHLKNYVCAYATGPLNGQNSKQCYEDPYIAVIKQHEMADPLYMNMAIGFGISAFVSGLLAVIFFLKYRSRHFCDRKKKKKTKSKKESTKTGGEKSGATKTEAEKTGTTAGTTAGETAGEKSGTTAGASTGEKSGATTGGVTGTTGADGTTGGASGTTGGATGGATGATGATADGSKME